MSEDKMLKTLNPHQKAYVDFDLANPQNGEYMLGAFHLVPEKGYTILQAACEVAAESSTGTNFLVKTETPFSKQMNAMVYKVEPSEEFGVHRLSVEAFRQARERPEHLHLRRG